MEAFTASRTALGVSLIRAIHARRDPDPVLADDWGERLVPQWGRDHYRDLALARMDPAARASAPEDTDQILADFFRGQPLYGNIVLRARWCEDALRRAVARGVRQYVILGAGFDSFALRRPDFAADVEIFEIDHPATQDLKVEQLARAGVDIPEGVHLIAADLSQENLGEALARWAFRSDRPAFFSWLGVSIYLTREANLTTLAAISRASAPGSPLAFSYADEAIFTRAAQAASEAESLKDSTRLVASMGEPFLSGFDPARLAGELAAVGFDLLEDLSGPQLAERYGRTGAKALPTSASSRFALASVTDGPR